MQVAFGTVYFGVFCVCVCLYVTSYLWMSTCVAWLHWNHEKFHEINYSLYPTALRTHLHPSRCKFHFIYFPMLKTIREWEWWEQERKTAWFYVVFVEKKMDIWRWCVHQNWPDKRARNEDKSDEKEEDKSEAEKPRKNEMLLFHLFRR